MPDDVADAIESNAQAPKSMSVDGRSTSRHSLPDQIAADKYLANRTANATTGRTFGARSIVPHGSRG